MSRLLDLPPDATAEQKWCSTSSAGAAVLGPTGVDHSPTVAAGMERAAPISWAHSLSTREVGSASRDRAALEGWPRGRISAPARRPSSPTRSSTRSWPARPWLTDATARRAHFAAALVAGTKLSDEVRRDRDGARPRGHRRVLVLSATTSVPLAMKVHGCRSRHADVGWAKSLFAISPTARSVHVVRVGDGETPSPTLLKPGHPKPPRHVEQRRERGRHIGQAAARGTLRAQAGRQARVTCA